MTTTTLLGVGTAALLPCDGELVLAPMHPTATPGFQLRVLCADGVVTRAEALPGLMHRSAEKLFESRDLRQAMALADRHDWLSAISSEVGVALTLESALGITPPERATWIRTLLAETNRMSASLAFLAPVAGAARGDAEALRERLTDLIEVATGGRVHPGFARIGGVAAPLSASTLAAVDEVMGRARATLPAITDAISRHGDTVAGLAVLTRDEAVAFGTGGIVGRASGLNLDLRRDEPYLAYAELTDVLDVVTGTDGDARARYDVLVRQLPVSVALIAACVEALLRLGDGPVDVPLPKVVRLPEGTTYTSMEGPLGISGCLVVGSGEKTPWRMKVRSASFATMQSMEVALPGTPCDRLADAVMSFPMVIGDVDR